MALFGKNRKNADNNPDTKDSTTSAQDPIDPDNKNYPKDKVARMFFSTIDRVVKVQGPAISSYVQRIKDKHPDKSLAEQQEQLDKQFLMAATTTGAGTGSVAAFPGIGTALSLAGIAGEAVLLLEACAAYAIASAELHGMDTSDEEIRRTIVFLAVYGANDKEIVAALTQEGALSSVKSLRDLRRSSRPQLMKANSILGRMAFRQLRKRLKKSMFRKVLPLGVGVVLGASANRAIAKEMIKHVHGFINSPEAQRAIAGSNNDA
ncbi:hypothetical protein F7230_02320 [Corynebacterium sp. 320]|uniref:hypothetical protein n=1 Tax=Corynebacterium TaxID=1716 RepID=UPI00125CCB39|nr:MULTISPECIES: hypothetical protein [Corynebacterium]KAB1503961.1 hypothetical protein F7230_02320 [Corynebacterium sp. 320]KAB1552940.1 hypothetical protein F7233_04275 [Corynebacterium sp. 321]KAB1553840.1 hypothetical protein F7232_02305 [Corynebacterium sp. 319]KAB3528097.1 hypothetical protein F8354_02320 [Corynebacterium sp. 250]KAB3540415.1 hypothetical protein F8390_04020 [Corynebacterium sp. 366]